MSPELLDIEDARLADVVETLSAEAIDRLPFGCIRLDAGGVVTLYSRREREQSGYRGDAMGQHFFAKVAPCMDNPSFRGRLEAARKAGRLNIRFDYISDLPSGKRDVSLQVRLMSASDGGVWVFLQHED